MVTTAKENSQRKKEPASQQEIPRVDMISENQVTTNAYHQIMVCVSEFSNISARIPKALLHVVQHIHGSLDNTAYCVYKCGNKKDIKEKSELLEEALENLMYLYNRLDYLFNAKAITLGQVNHFIGILKAAYIQIEKWYTYTLTHREDR